MERRGGGVKGGAVGTGLAEDVEAGEGVGLGCGVSVGLGDIAGQGVMEVGEELFDGVLGAVDEKADAAVGEVFDGAGELRVALGEALGGEAEADALDPAGEVDRLSGHGVEGSLPAWGGIGLSSAP